jgi:hypothetical protein
MHNEGPVLKSEDRSVLGFEYRTLIIDKSHGSTNERRLVSACIVPEVVFRRPSNNRELTGRHSRFIDSMVTGDERRRV